MQKAAEKPFTLTIRKNFTSGRPITFSGRRAQAFAREMLENTIILNSHAKDEKRETLRLLSEAVKSGETLVAAAPGEKETAAAKYKQDFQALWESDHILQSKLRGGCPGAALPVKAARQLIIDEHLPILLSTIQSLGSMLHSAVSKNDGKMAEKWLHRLKGGVERIDALSNLLDALTMDSIWEIKALAEHTCTRAALRLAGIEIGADAKKGEMLRASAAYLEELGRKLGTVEGARLVSLLVEIAMASEDKGKLAQGGRAMQASLGQE